jgi:RNA recognition motif-containing protein
MSKTLFVGNLTWEVSADDLLTLFQAHGQVVHTQVVTDIETGRSRGFGFVEMNDADAAQRAIDALNGQVYHGRPLTVHEAAPRSPSGRG